MCIINYSRFTLYLLPNSNRTLQDSNTALLREAVYASAEIFHVPVIPTDHGMLPPLPFPMSFTLIIGFFGSLDVMLITAVSVPADVGLNVTLMEIPSNSPFPNPAGFLRVLALSVKDQPKEFFP